jgi:signal transduction histidine kinase
MTGRIGAMSIRWKLLLAAMLTTAVVQLFAGVILAVYESEVFRTHKSQEVRAEASILASIVTASVTFRDARSAQEYLYALKASPEIVAAGVYGLDGQLFAGYVRDGAVTHPVPGKAEPVGQYYDGDRLIVVVPVAEEATPVGSVYLRAVIEPAWVRMLHYSGIVLAVLVGSLMIVVPVSLRLNRSVSQPIREIAAAASLIAAGDLSQDIAPGDQADEIGLLAKAFRQMVASLREMTGDLERRVLQRTAQLDAANKELEAFSYSISHDLRAPLRAIDGFSRMIEEDCADQLDNEGRRLLSVVRGSARRMGNLIDDLLAFSKFGRQSINAVDIDMAAMAREVCAEIQGAHSGAAVAFDISLLPTAQADRPLLRQVWVNLLSNAAKYSSARDNPTVQVSGEETERELTYRVRDNGAGFDMKYYARLFGVFQRLHTDAEFSGTGVGLAIVQRIIVRHGGRVWAEGEVGVGATFFFSLPRP